MSTHAKNLGKIKGKKKNKNTKTKTILGYGL